MNYLRFFQRHYPLLLGVPLLAVALAFFISSQADKVYQSTATMVVLNRDPADLLPGQIAPAPEIVPTQGPAPVSPTQAPGSLSELLVEQRLISTYLELVERRPVLEAAAESLQFAGTIEEMDAKVWVSNPPDTQLINVHATDPDPDAAAAIANAVATEFIRLTETEVGRPGLLSLVEPASPSITPVEPNTMVTVVMAGALALVGSVTLGLLLDKGFKTVRSPADVEEVSSLPTLGVIPAASSRERAAAWTGQAGSGWADSFRRLRGALTGTGLGTTFHSLLITSEKDGVGKSILAANLSVAYANAGFRVLLIDLDLHRPTQHQIFGLSNESGIANHLTANARNGHVPWVETQFRNLAVVPAGNTELNPEDVLALGLPDRFIQAAFQQADIVIVDGPSLAKSSSAEVLPSVFEASLIVVAAGKTTEEHLRRTVDSMDQYSANLIGVVLNKAGGVKPHEARSSGPRGSSSTAELLGPSPRTRDNNRRRRALHLPGRRAANPDLAPRDAAPSSRQPGLIREDDVV